MPPEDDREVEVGSDNPGAIITKTDEAPRFDDGQELSHPSPFDEVLKKLSSGKKASEAISELKEETKKKAEKSLKETLGDPKENAEPKKEEEAKKQDEPEPDAAKEDDEDPSEDGKTSDVDAAKEGAETQKGKEGEEAADKQEESEIPEAELKVLPHDKPKTARRIQALLKKVEEVSSKEATTAKQLQEKEAKLAELEKQLGEVKSVDPTTNEEIKKQLDELAMYRRRYELDNDPEVKQKFDSRIEGAETSIKDIFAKKRGGEALNKIIEEEGGWVKFAESSRAIKLSDGTELTAAELAEQIRKELPLSERRALDAAEIDQASARRERQRYLEEQSLKAKEYFESRQKQELDAKQKQEAAVKELQKKITDWETKFVSESDFFKEVPTDGLSGEKLTEAQERNRHVAQLKQVLKKNMGANDLDSTLNVLAESVLYHEERRRHAEALDKVKALEAQLKERQAEIDKYKKASSTTPRSGSLAGTGSAPSASSKPLSFEEAMLAKARERLGQ